MQRVLGVAVVALVALTVFQFAALRRMREEVAVLRDTAAALDAGPRREELARAGEWVDAWLRSPQGGGRAAGLCPGGAPDMDAIAWLVFGVYLHARASGASEVAAREAVIHAVPVKRQR